MASSRERPFAFNLTEIKTTTSCLENDVRFAEFSLKKPHDFDHNFMKEGECDDLLLTDFFKKDDGETYHYVVRFKSPSLRWIYELDELIDVHQISEEEYRQANNWTARKEEGVDYTETSIKTRIREQFLYLNQLKTYEEKEKHFNQMSDQIWKNISSSLREYWENQLRKTDLRRPHVHSGSTYWFGRKQITIKNRQIVNKDIDNLKFHFNEDEKLRELWIMKKTWSNGTTHMYFMLRSNSPESLQNDERFFSFDECFYNSVNYSETSLYSEIKYFKKTSNRTHLFHKNKDESVNGKRKISET